MALDVKESLTKKLGPLPAWGWGVAIGGALLARKLLTKGSSGAAPTSSAGTAGGVIGGGGSGSNATTAPGDPFSGPSSQVQQLQDQLTKLQDTITQQGTASADQTSQLTTLQDALTAAQDAITGQQGAIAGLSDANQHSAGLLDSFKTLQTQLSSEMQKLAAAYSARDEASAALARDRARYVDHLINQGTYNGDVAIWQPKYDAANAQVAASQANVTTLQSQLQGLGV